MRAHFKKHGDEYLLSPAGSLLVIADAIHSPDAGADGKARAKWVVENVMSAARSAKFKQTDILETMLASKPGAVRMLPMLDALVKCVGSSTVIDIIREGLTSTRPGDAA